VIQPEKAALFATRPPVSETPAARPETQKPRSASLSPRSRSLLPPPEILRSRSATERLRVTKRRPKSGTSLPPTRRSDLGARRSVPGRGVAKLDFSVAGHPLAVTALAGRRFGPGRRVRSRNRPFPRPRFNIAPAGFSSLGTRPRDPRGTLSFCRTRYSEPWFGV
jgi:hypothetical protein